MKVIIKIGNFLKGLIIGFASSGVDNPNDIELVRKVFISNFFSFIGFIFTFPLGISALMRSSYLLAFILFIVASVYTASYLYLRFSHNYLLTSRVILYLHSLLMIYLLADGGVKNTGALWVYTLPGVFFFINGFHDGLRDSVLFFILLAIVFILPENSFVTADYSNEFKVRFICSMVAVTFLSGLHEYSRMRSSFTMLREYHMLETAAKTDPLTELPNRRGMHERLNIEFQRYDGFRNIFSILMADIDLFKKINDTYGHDCGDMVLKQLAGKLRSALRSQDYISRWGGEEFLILLPDTRLNGALVIAEKVRKIIEDTKLRYSGSNIRFTISLGVAEIMDSSSIDFVIHKADKMLYKAKFSGRNRVFPKPKRTIS